jgi:hypothetical protein
MRTFKIIWLCVSKLVILNGKSKNHYVLPTFAKNNTCLDQSDNNI